MRILSGFIVVAISLLVSFGLLEVYTRVFEADGQNFDIEMWRYAQDLKRVSDIPGMGHEHVPGGEGIYMGVPVKINSVGWRDEEHPLEKPAASSRPCLENAREVTSPTFFSEKDQSGISFPATAGCVRQSTSKSRTAPRRS